MNIDFIIPNKNQGWAYPLIKWKKELKKKGLDVNVVAKPNFKNKRDIVILSSRFYRNKYETNNIFFENLKEDVKRDTDRLRKFDSKIVYYDLSASPGSKELSVINDVDLFLKRQLYKDKDIYTHTYHPNRIWLEGENSCHGISKDQLHKINLGWNLGYQDYANWPLFNPNKFKLFFFNNPTFISPMARRSITASYRGKMAGQTVPQRKGVVETLKKLNNQNPKSFVTGSVINKNKYIKEVQNTKAMISPFGYGEICYRDMEAFINGCILIKPNMDHLETFPNFYIKNETYIPTKWDLSDLKDILLDVDKNYGDYLEIAKKGQELFKNNYYNFDIFYNHFENIVNKISK
ncbi:hypothetical protein K8354_09825 [Polaribacter litorisediminis]|uniref:hypothetical protein n=1 Tax=Polaribacter litorisediminis TaxID=1908341 RepID=UPI001CBAB783|nr:hypothetical protein [Polaribacter litorisediminis]UAM96639.1 hypothetical protein K8354_09825 [Polaribacter litorisediminis]